MSDRSPFGERAAGEPPFVFAHRGASALEPENTLAAFARAAELGADGIELDVQLTRDGIAVVLHDPALYRAGGVFHLHDPGDAERVLVGSLEIADFAAPTVFPDGSRHPIARFDEALEAIPEWQWLDVELKAGGTYDPRLSDVVAGHLRRRSERTLVSSFDHFVLRELAERAPQIPRAALCDARLIDPRSVLAPIPATMLNLRRSWCTRADVERWRSAGVAVCLYGGEILFDLADVSTWPVSGLFLDDPRLKESFATARPAQPA